MLKKLDVQNYALIDQLQLHFGKGLNIITGETGAGKSILMGALGLLLGDRADSSSLLDKTRKCIIEGEFLTTNRVKSFLEKEELDMDNVLIVHREINKDGKSRAFINDTPVNLSQLKQLGNLLVDIHSQHETLLLNQSDFQLAVVDAFANHQVLLNDFKHLFREYKISNQELQRLIEEENKSAAEQDYLQFQFNELNEANLTENEQGKLEEEFSALTHAGEIKSSIAGFYELLNGSEDNLLSALSNATGVVNGLVKYLPGLNDVVNRLKSVQVELKDIDFEIQQLAKSIVPDPKRMELIGDRLNLIYKLQQKHHFNTVQDLITLRDSLKEKLNSFSSLADKIGNHQRERDKLFQQLNKKADIISENRNKAIPSIENKIKKLLGELGMPNAVLKIEINTLSPEEIYEGGKDRVKFLFSANKGIPFSDISKVASGGELSRLMLCLKASVAALIEMPTIVFDEIDTGVSGETAFKIGKVMQDLSSSHQLISISHLPQIASRGEDHFYVFKEVINKKTVTQVRKLSYDERVVEIARMLSGDKPTKIAMQNAKELLSI
jgi:DNA repair protein RecN (Recombination protein N)